MRDSTVREFLGSRDKLRVYKGDRLLFASSRERLLPLLEYTDTCTPHEHGITVLDRVIGNAAALLLARVSCTEAFGELGSELAAHTLEGLDISYRFGRTVPFIQNNRRDGMCPMEELSLGKTPEEFYQALRERISGGQG